MINLYSLMAALESVSGVLDGISISGKENVSKMNFANVTLEDLIKQIKELLAKAQREEKERQQAQMQQESPEVYTATEGSYDDTDAERETV